MSESRGEAIARRMSALGMKPTDVMRYGEKIDKKVHRNQVSKATKSDGGVSDGVYDRIELVLDRFEKEIGGSDRPQTSAADEPKNDLVEFRLTGNFGVDVVVRGPVSDLAELEAAVERLMGRMGESGVK